MPWVRLHLDFARQFKGKMILVLIDAHSKWIEAICTPSTSSAASSTNFVHYLPNSVCTVHVVDNTSIVKWHDKRVVSTLTTVQVIHLFMLREGLVAHLVDARGWKSLRQLSSTTSIWVALTMYLLGLGLVYCWLG